MPRHGRAPPTWSIAAFRTTNGPCRPSPHDAEAVGVRPHPSGRPGRRPGGRRRRGPRHAGAPRPVLRDIDGYRLLDARTCCYTQAPEDRFIVEKRGRAWLVAPAPAKTGRAHV